MKIKITKNDWIFIGIVVAVLGIFWAISGEEKTKFVPNNEIHAKVYEVMKQTGSKREAEKDCEKCHQEMGVPYPKDHPPKNRCLFCHKLHKPQ